MLSENVTPECSEWRSRHYPSKGWFPSSPGPQHAAELHNLAELISRFQRFFCILALS